MFVLILLHIIEHFSTLKHQRAKASHLNHHWKKYFSKTFKKYVDILITKCYHINSSRVNNTRAKIQTHFYIHRFSFLPHHSLPHYHSQKEEQAT